MNQKICGDSDIEIEVDELFGDSNAQNESESVPLEIFTPIDWNITNSIWEGRSTFDEIKKKKCRKLESNKKRDVV